MYFHFACASCQKTLKVRAENAGRGVRCPDCRTTPTVKAAQAGQLINEPDASAHVLSASGRIVETIGDASASGTDVGIWRRRRYGLAARILFDTIVIPCRDFPGYVRSLFLEHGWVPFALWKVYVS